MNKITEIWINGKQIKVPNEQTIKDVIRQLNIQNGAQKNVQSDWNATEGDAFILNKPRIPKELKESDISNWGFGKIKSIKVNGQTLHPNSTTGVLNLGALDVIQAGNVISSQYELPTLQNEDLAVQPQDTYEEAFGKIEKNVLDNELITSAALNDLNKKIKEINKKLENGDFVPGGGSGGTIARRLDNPIYYSVSDDNLNEIPQDNSSNVSITNVYVDKEYFYVAIPSDYEMKVITENNENITNTNNFNIPKSTFNLNNIEYKLFEFHLDSGLALDVNVTINIIL